MYYKNGENSRNVEAFCPEIINFMGKFECVCQVSDVRSQSMLNQTHKPKILLLWLKILQNIHSKDIHSTWAYPQPTVKNYYKNGEIDRNLVTSRPIIVN
ncbi:hypothetical protein CEXT_808861 [Caerostris extrusa]|uniref:Uncharacterized protein n=1 Tax=Caerostris extrusa TaxID=172846 RepID=A0AAV4WYE0_CAEEX|nr:hypothetical protein CEXT_808861 [Caerostris extrusa]